MPTDILSHYFGLVPFTEDINNGLIRYILNYGAEPELGDRFVFDVADSKPNTVLDTVFRIRWSLIHFQKGSYNISEKAGVISVPVTRSGNLNQVRFKKCMNSLDWFGSISDCLTLRGFVAL